MATNWFKHVCDQLHNSQYDGKRVRRLGGRMYDLGTLTGRWGFAGEIVKYTDLLTPEQFEIVAGEVAVLTGINVEECLYSSLLRTHFGADNVKVVNKQDNHTIRCKDCCKWQTVACPMAENVEALIGVSTMFDDDRVIEYALNRYCSEAEREGK